MRPRLLLLGDTLNLGGTEGQFAAVACGLDRAAWGIDVACLGARGPLTAKLAEAGIHPWSCGPSSFKSPRAGAAIWRLARRLRADRVEIVHSFDFYSNLMGVLAGRLARVPRVIASQRDLGNLRPPLQQRVHRAVLRLATHVVVNSPAIADRLCEQRTVRPDRIVFVPNALDTRRFAPAARTRGPELTVTTIANLRPEKGIAYLIEAAAHVRHAYPATRFRIWGAGPLGSELASLVGRLGLGDCVELCGTTTTPEAALRAADIFVLPSVSEACSNVLLEAMATGVPVVATRVGGNVYTVEDQSRGLLVPPRDPEALAKAVIQLIERPELAAALAARAREYAVAEFSAERMLGRLDALYRGAFDEAHR